MSSAAAEPSDLESAPLLAGQSRADDDDIRPQKRSFMKSLTDPDRDWTLNEKVLAGIAFAFLALMAVFVGLFAGAEHKLKTRPPTEVIETTTVSLPGHIITVTSTQQAPAPTTVPIPPPTQPEVCLTAECVVLASKILESIDTSVDPCEDFYSFANGGWIKANPLPKSKGIFGSFNEVQLTNRKVLLDVVKTPVKQLPSKATEVEKAEHSNLEKLRTVFDDCVDEDALDAIGLAPLASILDEVKTLFPAYYPSSSASSPSFHELVSSESLVSDALAAVEKILHGGRPSKVAATSSTELKPSKNQKKHRKEALTKVLAYLHARGVSSLFGFAVEGDVGRDPQFQILGLYQDGTGLPSKEYYEEPSIVSFYTEVVQNVLTHVIGTASPSSHALQASNGDGGWSFPTWPWKHESEDAHKTTLRSLAKAVVDFEAQLSAAQVDPEDVFNPDKAYNLFPFANVSKSLPIDLADYVSAFAPRNYPKDIMVATPSYLVAMNDVLAGTEDHILQAYFVTRATFKHAKLLGPNVAVRKEAERFTSVLSGIKPGAEVDREEVCLGQVSNVVGHLAGAEFIKTAFAGDSKAKAENIIVSIIAAFKDRLRTSVPWMDAPSRARALDKASAITPKIGYPLYPNATNPISLRNYYSRQAVIKGDFFGTVSAATQYEAVREWQVALGNQRNQNIWGMYADTVNAYFQPSDNEIVFPAGILQPPFFSASWPSYLSFGAFGAVAAHELAHAFDNTGAKYDDEGRYRQWWTNSTLEAFQERADCIVKQYSDFYVVSAEGKKVHVNGVLTNGENIGDSGLRLAWQAWKASIPEGEAEITLPGLAYTNEQLFFLAFGRIWAQNISPASAVQRVRTDPHSPNEFRVEGTLQNFEKFAEVFQCKAGSRMNPKKKCELW